MQAVVAVVALLQKAHLAQQVVQAAAAVAPVPISVTTVILLKQEVLTPAVVVVVDKTITPETVVLGSKIKTMARLVVVVMLQTADLESLSFVINHI
jgi:hypothetical protein